MPRKEVFRRNTLVEMVCPKFRKCVPTFLAPTAAETLGQKVISGLHRELEPHQGCENRAP
jgi:hypothetical protein